MGESGVMIDAQKALTLIENELREAHSDSDMTDGYVSKIEAAFKTVRDALDNQRHNLRAVTRTQNECNKPARKNKSSKYKGVTWLKTLKKWQAKIKIGGTKISLGYFPLDQEIQAALAYNEAALKYHGQFAHLNSLDAVLSEGK